MEDISRPPPYRIGSDRDRTQKLAPCYYGSEFSPVQILLQNQPGWLGFAGWFLFDPHKIKKKEEESKA
jgi:hypothetical protein